MPAESPKLDTAGFFAARPTALKQLPSPQSPFNLNLVEASWAFGVNDLGEVCGAINAPGSSVSEVEHWQPSVWTILGASTAPAFDILPIAVGTVGGCVNAMDSNPALPRRACGFVSVGPYHNSTATAAGWEHVSSASIDWCVYRLTDVTLPRHINGNGPLLDVAYDIAETGQIVAIGDGEGVLLTHHCDLNGDLGIDAADVSFVMNGWGSLENDVTGDGVTDAVDLVTIYNNWTDGAIAMIPRHCGFISDPVAEAAQNLEDGCTFEMAHEVLGTSIDAMRAWQPSCSNELNAFHCACNCIKCVYVVLKGAQ